MYRHAEYRYPKRHYHRYCYCYTECHYAECRYLNYHFVECYGTTMNPFIFFYLKKFNFKVGFSRQTLTLMVRENPNGFLKNLFLDQNFRKKFN
jgi:hypothetical protein